MFFIEISFLQRMIAGFPVILNLRTIFNRISSVFLERVNIIMLYKYYRLP